MISVAKLNKTIQICPVPSRRSVTIQVPRCTEPTCRSICAVIYTVIQIINTVFSPLIEEGITYSTIGGCIVISGMDYELYKYDENLSFPEVDKMFPPIYDD